MEAGRRLLSSSPSPPPPPPPHSMLPRTQLRSSSTICSVPMTHDQASRAVSHVPATSVVRHFPASVLSKEQRDDFKNMSFNRIEKVSQIMLDKQQAEIGRLCCEEKEKYEFAKYLKDFENRLLLQPGLWYPFLLTQGEEECETDIVVTKDGRTMQSENIAKPISPAGVLALAKKAVMASKKVATLVEESNALAEEFNESQITGSGSEASIRETFIEEKVIVRSKRLLERRYKKRKVPNKPIEFVNRGASLMKANRSKKIEKLRFSNDPLRLFLWGPETKQLLTVKEEKDLFVQIQDLMRLEEVQQRLQFQLDREPTLAEWAQAVGMSCQVLKSQIYSGRRSRDKMIYANFRLVVHVARQYEGKGLNIQDLLQEGSRGLMKSLEKFKPKAGCRFPTYAYWWIRQTIRKAIFLNSRSIRLPESVFALLRIIRNARRLCTQDGHLPTTEEIARCAGITVSKLESLLVTSRSPLSIQGRVWLEHDVIFQEITADPAVEVPDLVVAKQMMRQHVYDLLSILKPRERQILQYRFGIHDGERKTLTEIGVMYGLSKERIRQLESRALDKLKECFPSEELEEYLDLLI